MLLSPPTPHDISTWHLEEKPEFKLLTNFTIRLTNEMQALSRQSEPQKLVWSGWKEIIRGLISPIQGRNRWQSRRCTVSHFWCTKSRSSLPRISSLSTLTTLELSAFLSPSFHPLTLSLSLFSVAEMMKVWEAHTHHYAPQIPKCVMVWPVGQNNGHLLTLLKW